MPENPIGESRKTEARVPLSEQLFEDVTGSTVKNFSGVYRENLEGPEGSERPRLNLEILLDPETIHYSRSQRLSVYGKEYAKAVFEKLILDKYQDYDKQELLDALKETYQYSVGSDPNENHAFRLVISSIRGRLSQKVSEEKIQGQERKNKKLKKVYRSLATAGVVAGGLIGGIKYAESNFPFVVSFLKTYMLGSQTAEDVSFQTDDPNLLIIESTSFVTPQVSPSYTPTQTATPEPTKEVEAVKSPTLEKTPAVATTTPVPTTKSTEIPTPTTTPSESNTEVSKTWNIYKYLQQSILVGLDGLGKVVKDQPELLSEIAKIKEKFKESKPLIINIIATDRSHLGEPRDFRSYYSEGNEHIGNSDGIVQIIINNDGSLDVISFGRDLWAPYMIADPDSPDKYTPGRLDKLLAMGGPIVLYDKTGKKTGVKEDKEGIVESWLSNGRMKALFGYLTGNESDLNFQVSLGELYKLSNALFPNGLDIKLKDGFSSSQVKIPSDKMTHITGLYLIQVIQQRNAAYKGMKDNQKTYEELDSNTRGINFLKKLLIDNPGNIPSILKSVDPDGFVKEVFNKDLKDKHKEFLVNGDIDDLILYTVLSQVSKQDKDFGTNITATFARAFLEGKITFYAMQPVTGDTNNILLGYQNQIKKITNS